MIAAIGCHRRSNDLADIIDAVRHCRSAAEISDINHLAAACNERMIGSL
jgi:hypothetical protein